MFLLIFLALLICAHGQAIQDGWKIFSPPDGGFAVQLPGSPQDVSQPMTSKSGVRQVHIFEVLTTEIDYSVGYVDFESALEDPKLSKKILDGVRDKMVAKESGKLLSEIDVALASHPGREFVIQASDGVFRDRLYLVGKRYYFLTAFVPLLKEPTKEQTDNQSMNARKFLASFELRSSAEKPN